MKAAAGVWKGKVYIAPNGAIVASPRGCPTRLEQALNIRGAHGDYELTVRWKKRKEIRP